MLSQLANCTDNFPNRNLKSCPIFAKPLSIYTEICSPAIFVCFVKMAGRGRVIPSVADDPFLRRPLAPRVRVRSPRQHVRAAVDEPTLGEDDGRNVREVGRLEDQRRRLYTQRPWSESRSVCVSGAVVKVPDVGERWCGVWNVLSNCGKTITKDKLSIED